MEPSGSRSTGIVLLIIIMLIGAGIYYVKNGDVATSINKLTDGGTSTTEKKADSSSQDTPQPEETTSQPTPRMAVIGSNPVTVAQSVISVLKSTGSPNLAPDMDAYIQGIKAYDAGNFSEALSSLSQINSGPRDMLAPVLMENSRVLLEGNEYIEIAVAGPMTGDQALKGQAELAGAALAQQEINRNGGISGKKIVIDIFDDRANKGNPTINAAKSVVNSKALAVIGHIGSSNTLAAAPIYEAGKIAAISPSSSSTKISNAGDYIFRVCSDDNAQGKALVDYAKQTGIKKAAIVYLPSDDYSRTLHDAIMQEMRKVGINPGGEYIYEKEQMDFSETVSKIKASKVDAVFFSGTQVEGSYFIIELKKEAPSVKVLGGDALYIKDLLQTAGNSANGLITTTFFHAKAGFPFEADFVKNFEETFKGTPNARSALAYDAMYAIANALEESQNINRAGVEEGLKMVSFQGATGRIKFDNKGDVRGKPVVILRVENPNFVPVKAIYDNP
ncbi:MAG: ABC transporter substrate-binding protein [Candidatus Saccharibacteria bacterium]